MYGREKILRQTAYIRKKSFNTYGDIDLDTCQKNILPGGYDVNQKVRFTEDVVQPEFLELYECLGRAS